MPITALPTPPLRSDPNNFAARGDAFLAALPTFVTEANALAVGLNLNSTTDTSVSSVLIGLGAKTLTVSAGKSFQGGMYLVIASTSSPSTNSMFGQITSYSGTTLVVNVLSVRGSGTLSSWTISQSSAGGAAVGPIGGSGITGAAVAGPIGTSGITGAAVAGPLASSGITDAAASGANTDITSITGNAATATKLSNDTGSAPSYSCRAWVNFNGTGTVVIRASGNVSSITDNGVGDYTVNFTTAMPDANYCPQATGQRDVLTAYDAVLQALPLNASSVQIRCSQGAAGLEDMARVFVAIFR